MAALRVAVCEDQEEERERLLAMLAACSVENVPTAFASGEELLAEYRPDQFDLLLMDIYMGDMTGIETVERVRQMGESVPVAFLTTSADYTWESRRLSALMYLEKPVKWEKLEETLKLARMKLDNRPTLVVYQGGEVENLPLEDILFLEQQGRQVCIVTRNGGTTTVYGKLSDLLPQLEGAPFFQTHKSYCVHLAQVVKVDEALRCFVMAGGKNVPIRRLLMGKAKRAWVDFLFAQTRGER